jgi:hypothetical protein
MSNFIQGMVQQLVADQRSNSEESRNQAISIANLAGQEQRMKMLESEHEAKENERNRKNAFSGEVSYLASTLLFDEKDVADANGKMTKQRVPKQFASRGEQIAAVAKLQTGKLALATKYGLIDDKTLQDSYAFSRQLEMDGTNTLIENLIADPSNPQNMVAIATKFGLDPDTTSIEIGTDKDGMPTVIAKFMGPDNKEQQRDLGPTFNAMGADAYARLVQNATTKASLRKTESEITANRAKARSEGAPKALNDKDRVSMIKDLNDQVRDIVRQAKDSEIGTKEWIGNEAQRKKLNNEIDNARTIAGNVIDFNVNNNNYKINPIVAYGYGRDFARYGDTALIELHKRKNIQDIKPVGRNVYAITNDGYYIPVDETQLKRFGQYREIQLNLKNSQTNTATQANTNDQAIPYDPSTMPQ